MTRARNEAERLRILCTSSQGTADTTKSAEDGSKSRRRSRDKAKRSGIDKEEKKKKKKKRRRRGDESERGNPYGVLDSPSVSDDSTRENEKKLHDKDTNRDFVDESIEFCPFLCWFFLVFSNFCIVS